MRPKSPPSLFLARSPALTSIKLSHPLRSQLTQRLRSDAQIGRNVTLRQTRREVWIQLQKMLITFQC